jgi:hypothetical protein
MTGVMSLSSTKVRSSISDIRYAKCHVRRKIFYLQHIDIQVLLKYNIYKSYILTSLIISKTALYNELWYVLISLIISKTPSYNKLYIV